MLNLQCDQFYLTMPFCFSALKWSVMYSVSLICSYNYPGVNYFNFSHIHNHAGWLNCAAAVCTSVTKIANFTDQFSVYYFYLQHGMDGHKILQQTIELPYHFSPALVTWAISLPVCLSSSISERDGGKTFVVSLVALLWYPSAPPVLSRDSRKVPPLTPVTSLPTNSRCSLF